MSRTTSSSVPATVAKRANGRCRVLVTTYAIALGIVLTLPQSVWRYCSASWHRCSIGCCATVDRQTSVRGSS